MKFLLFIYSIFLFPKEIFRHINNFNNLNINQTKLNEMYMIINLNGEDMYLYDPYWKKNIIK